jgi:hypothetical protein
VLNNNECQSHTDNKPKGYKVESRHSKKPDKEPQQPQSGSTDYVLEYMKEHGIPLTRENYLNEAYMGEPPEELGPELEAELPEQFQKWDDL